jgi:hypothetical protein
MLKLWPELFKGLLTKARIFKEARPCELRAGRAFCVNKKQAVKNVITPRKHD